MQFFYLAVVDGTNPAEWKPYVRSIKNFRAYLLEKNKQVRESQEIVEFLFEQDGIVLNLDDSHVANITDGTNLAKHLGVLISLDSCDDKSPHEYRDDVEQQLRRYFHYLNEPRDAAFRYLNLHLWIASHNQSVTPSNQEVRFLDLVPRMARDILGLSDKDLNIQMFNSEAQMEHQMRNLIIEINMRWSRIVLEMKRNGG